MAAEILPLFGFGKPEQKAYLVSQILRQNFDSLGTTNWTTNASYPLNPRDGMMRVLDLNGAGTDIQLQMRMNGVWLVLLNHLELLMTIAQRMEVTVTPAAAVWTITHGMGVKPLVQTFDAANLFLTPVSIEHVSIAGAWDRVVVTHGVPETGYAILIG